MESKITSVEDMYLVVIVDILPNVEPEEVLVGQLVRAELDQCLEPIEFSLSHSLRHQAIKRMDYLITLFCSFHISEDSLDISSIL